LEPETSGMFRLLQAVLGLEQENCLSTLRVGTS